MALSLLKQKHVGRKEIGSIDYVVFYERHQVGEKPGSNLSLRPRKPRNEGK